MIAEFADTSDSIETWNDAAPSGIEWAEQTDESPANNAASNLAARQSGTIPPKIDEFLALFSTIPAAHRDAVLKTITAAYGRPWNGRWSEIVSRYRS